MLVHFRYRWIIFVLALCVCSRQLHAANNDPVILVHGFLGFGPEQYANTGFRYWGGFDDLVAHMGAGGKRTVHAASVGPISSSWDRAAELYYQIKGGCVDYGSHHSARFARFGAIRMPAQKCWAADPANNPNRYPMALYPAWDADHPIHLIGHSQGGQTIRLLIQLLENGSPDGDEGGGELYAGGKRGWVKSVTTLSAPHDGTSLHDAIGEFEPALSSLMGGVASIARKEKQAAAPAAIEVEHFGMVRHSAEQAARFAERSQAAPFWDQENYDKVQHEMGPDGARAFNAWVKTSPRVYYFSVANVATEAGGICCNETDRTGALFQKSRYHYPRRDMAPLTRPYAGEWMLPLRQRRGMGSYTQSAPGRVAVDDRWFPNDGVVNTVSMRAPTGHPVRDFDGTPLRGTWNFLGTYRGIDHFDIVGWPSSAERIYPLYDRITDLLFRL